MGAPLSIIIIMGFSSSSAIILLYLAVLGTGAQNITVNRDTRRSNYLDKYKGVRQQNIIKYK